MTVKEVAKFIGKIGEIMIMKVEAGAIKRYADAVEAGYRGGRPNNTGHRADSIDEPPIWCSPSTNCQGIRSNKPVV